MNRIYTILDAGDTAVISYSCGDITSNIAIPEPRQFNHNLGDVLRDVDRMYALTKKQSEEKVGISE